MIILMWICLLLMFVWLIILQCDLNNFKENAEEQLRILREQKLSEDCVVNIDEKVKEYDIKQADADAFVKKSEPEAVRNSTETVEPKNKTEFEKLFLGNIFNKIGAIAIIAGFGIFIKLISQYVVFTPEVKISAGVIAGIVLIFISLKLHANEMKNYAEVLCGTGFAVIFIAVCCAAALYHLFPIPLSVIIGILLIFFSYFLADKYKSFSTILIGLFGGYIIPFFINPEMSVNFLFGFLIFLNLISIFYVRKNRDKILLNFINLLLTTLTVLICGKSVESAHSIALCYPLLLWTSYLLNDITLLMKNPNRELYDKNNVLAWCNYVVLIVFVNVIFLPDDKLSVGITVLCTALIYALLAFASKSKAYVYGFLSGVLIATYFLSDGVSRIALWSFEGLLTALVAKQYNLKYLENLILPFFVAAFTGIFLTENILVTTNAAEYIPVLNKRTFAFLIPVAAIFCSSEFLRTSNKQLSDLLRFGYLSLIYIYFCFELNAALNKVGGDYYIIDYTRRMSYLIIGFVYAIQMKKLYNISSYKLFNIASYSVCTICLILLLPAGFWQNPKIFLPILNVRFIAYVFAITAMLYYLKYNGKEFFCYAALILGCVSITAETNDLFVRMLDFPYQSAFAVSIALILYSGTIISAGIFKNIKALRLTGIWISIIAVVKIIFWDFSGIDAIYKVIAFIVTGIILLITSYFYTKNNKST